MLLTFDIGNTNVVCAVFEQDNLLSRWRITTEGKRTADEYAVWLTQLLNLEGIAPDAVEGAIIASVVPAAVRNLRGLCTRYFKVEPLLIGSPQVELGIAVNASQVGADRLVNTVAGYRLYGGDLIMIDFGTATTFDVVGPQGSYEGGVLAPGVNLTIESLYRASAQLPRIMIEKPETVVGKATVPAMQSGLYWGYVDMIEGIIARIKREIGRPMTVIATGGLAPLFTEACPSIEQNDPDLTLKGLEMIYRANKVKTA